MSTNLSLQGILETILQTEEENTLNQSTIKKMKQGRLKHKIEIRIKTLESTKKQHQSTYNLQ